VTFDDIGDGILAQPHLARDQAIPASLVNEGEHLGRQPVRLWPLACCRPSRIPRAFAAAMAERMRCLKARCRSLAMSWGIGCCRLPKAIAPSSIGGQAEFGIKPEDEERIVDHARFVEHSRQSPSTLRGDRDFLTVSGRGIALHLPHRCRVAGKEYPDFEAGAAAYYETEVHASNLSESVPRPAPVKLNRARPVVALDLDRPRHCSLAR
jgi:hypothetical protein